MLHRSVEITLIENATAYNQPKKFARQTVEISHVPDTVQTTADGHKDYGRHDSTVIWYEGKAKDLEAITNVKIVASDGAVLIVDDWSLNRTFVASHDVPKGVKFCVLQPDGPPHPV